MLYLCLNIVLYSIYAKHIPRMSSPTMQILLITCTNENDVTCLLARQFVMNEGADQTPIETYFD